MNMSAPSSPATASCARESTHKESRAPTDPVACDVFEQVLQSRQRQQRGGDDGQTPPSESALLPPMSAPVLSPMPAMPPMSRAGVLEPAATGTRAVIEASLRESPCPLVTPIGGGEAAMTWEAIVHEPNSVAVEVRAVRAEQSAFSEQRATWGLTIASPTVGAEVLARHAPRLNERLRKQAIGLDHVRIEHAEQDDQ